MTESTQPAPVPTADGGEDFTQAQLAEFLAEVNENYHQRTRRSSMQRWGFRTASVLGAGSAIVGGGTVAFGNLGLSSAVVGALIAGSGLVTAGIARLPAKNWRTKRAAALAWEQLAGDIQQAQNLPTAQARLEALRLFNARSVEIKQYEMGSTSGSPGVGVDRHRFEGSSYFR